MSSVSPEGGEPARRHRRATVEVKGSLRALQSRLALLGHQVGTRLKLRGADLDCLELLALEGPLSPSALARRAGLHPATMTGVLDRLQRDGWVVRERDPDAADRRAVTVRAVPGRTAEVFRAYGGMNKALDRVCADYTEEELALLGGFLRRVTEAGAAAADELADR